MKVFYFVCIVLLVTGNVVGCSKTKDPDPEPEPGPGPGGPVITPVVPVADPPLAATIGFFEQHWKPRSFTAPSYTEVTPAQASATVTVTIDASKIITKIPPTVWGHNANTWMTNMVGEPLFMQHIKALKPEFIRFPAGSLSDMYFWNAQPGQPPADAPSHLMDKDGVIKEAGYWYGKVNESWTASVDQYYEVLKQSGSIGVLTVNYGYARYGTSADPVAAAAHLAADWVRYDKGRTKYWEIGNETYGDWEAGFRIDLSANKDGQPEFVTGELYAQHVQVFVDSMKKAAAEVGQEIFIGATIYDAPTEAWMTNTTKTWNEGVLKNLKSAADFYIVHNYFTPFNENSTASVVMNAGLTVPAKMMQHIKKEMQTYGAPVLPVALTEWNMWAKDSKQQVSNVSGLFALAVMSESLVNQYGMALRWDLLNGWENGNDHGLFSDGNEPGIPKWTPRPSFYYMYYYSRLIGDRLVPAQVTGSTAIKAYASTYSSGEANLTLINTSDKPVTVQLKANNLNFGKRLYYYQLEGSNDNGEFSRKVLVNGEGPSLAAGGPTNYTQLKARSHPVYEQIKITVPALGAVILVL
ncbi:alpha-L-arabinofuranosidase [Flavihumibacter cheonanensis]|uniref:alpha-L-arabinofuranosidase n=1 Tax=Flavihumibacter cheonanensis TaxID=1442385 RepID=UPI001EF83BD9|nr:alpha-L-arabinofuranosidase [Flavihumibacter cheonanensis]MCG7754203.1 alpha-L-arabinofuranosidase [Flavihumibacter cheonanensis]